MKRRLRAIATHRVTLWVALAAALIFILWATAVSAQDDSRHIESGAPAVTVRR